MDKCRKASFTQSKNSTNTFVVHGRPDLIGSREIR